MSEFRPAFVTPAFGRYEVSEVVFAQRRSAIDELRRDGIDARAYVVADDLNLGIAGHFGLDVVERENDWLGARFNDGCEAAILDGATHVVPIGSDSWLVPSYLRRVDPSFAGVTTSARQAYVDEAGERIAFVDHELEWGIGPHVVPAALLEEPFRPWEEDIDTGCDSSLLDGIERRRGHVPTRWLMIDPAQYVSFKTKGNQINPYDAVVPAIGARELRGLVLARLAETYPIEHVRAAATIYERRRAAA